MMKKTYRIRKYSPIWWMRAVGIPVALIVAYGVMTSWDLGLL